MNPFTITVTGLAGPTWTSPDGKIKCFTITYMKDGQEISRETYSKTVAEVGWHGDVVEYAKNNRVYVKQPPREDYIQSSSQPAGGQISLDLVNRLEAAIERLEALSLPQSKDVVIPPTVTNEDLDKIIKEGLVDDF